MQASDGAFCTLVPAVHRALTLDFRRPVSAQPEQAGVGIIFKPSFNNDSFMALIVHDLVKGSSADRLGGIHRGDILQSIDGIDVFKRPAQEVSGLQNGGSPSWLHFLELIAGPSRKSDSDTDALIHVFLVSTAVGFTRNDRASWCVPRAGKAQVHSFSSTS